MAPLIAAAPVIGALASAGGALFTGISASEAASYQAKVASNNALIAQGNATRAIEAGQQQAQNDSLKNAAAYGQVVTGLAANNVDVNSGSAVDVLASKRAKGEEDTANTLYDAQVQAYGYRVNATSDTAQAQVEEATAENAPIGAALTASGGLLGNSQFTGALGGGSGGGIGTFTGGYGAAPTWIGGT